ncbi:UNVERIFIED_CONTAM: hypothetical protein RMT77_002513 [Armadillidium vulgare]
MLSDGVEKWISEGLSYGAWDSGTGQLVGVLISTLLTKHNGTPQIWSDLKSTNPISEIYVAFEKTMEEAVDIFELYPSVEKILELNLLCILPSYRGRKIGQTLVKHAENMGEEMGCRMAMAEASGRASQKILSNLGYKIVFEYPYENFEFEGKKVFDLSVMGDDLSDMIMLKELPLCKGEELTNKKFLLCKGELTNNKKTPSL